MRRPGSSRQRGAAAIEFALLAPVLILLLFGMVDFAMAINAQAVVGNAAREGARVASVGGNATAVRAAAMKSASSLMGYSTVSTPTVPVVADPVCTRADGTAEDCASATSGDTVAVTVTYYYQSLTPQLVGMQPTIPISRTVSMRRES